MNAPERKELKRLGFTELEPGMAWMGRTDGGFWLHLGDWQGNGWGADIFQNEADALNGREYGTCEAPTLDGLLAKLAENGWAVSPR